MTEHFDQLVKGQHRPLTDTDIDAMDATKIDYLLSDQHLDGLVQMLGFHGDLGRRAADTIQLLRNKLDALGAEWVAKP